MSHHWVKRFYRDVSGQDLIEYSLLVASISLLVVVSLQMLGTTTTQTYRDAATVVQGGARGGGNPGNPTPGAGTPGNGNPGSGNPGNGNPGGNPGNGNGVGNGGNPGNGNGGANGGGRQP